MTPPSSDDSARPEPVEGELYGPIEVGPMLGVKPQVVVNWIRDDRIHPSAVDELGRNRFTAADVRRIRASLGRGNAGVRPHSSGEGWRGGAPPNARDSARGQKGTTA